ncbi:hypothetical protein BaRGS_00014027 [Batillaria attramentaria]|uniref:Uncharacterized protein n=1 Tax=Batillaria attramentaria TaxID=370345 RepID=A0ABD0L5E1_9CAEN
MRGQPSKSSSIQVTSDICRCCWTTPCQSLCAARDKRPCTECVTDVSPKWQFNKNFYFGDKLQLLANSPCGRVPPAIALHNQMGLEAKLRSGTFIKMLFSGREAKVGAACSAVSGICVEGDSSPTHNITEKSGAHEQQC